MTDTTAPVLSADLVTLLTSQNLSTVCRLTPELC